MSTRLITIVAASMLTASAVLWGAWDYDPRLRVGMQYAICFVHIPAAILFAITYLIVRGGGRGEPYRSPRAAAWLAGVVMVTSVALVVHGFQRSRPIQHFRRLVLDPPPLSLSQLELWMWHSFSDGHGYVFTFSLAPDDFARLQDSHALVEETSPMRVESVVKYQSRFGVDSAWPSPRVFQNGRTTAITDQELRRVVLHLDRTVTPKPNRELERMLRERRSKYSTGVSQASSE